MDPVVQSIRQSDREALNRFLARHRDRLTDWVRFRLGVPAGRGADPSDAVQEISVKVWEAVQSFDGTNEAQLLSWFQRHLRWWVIDLSRRRVLRIMQSPPSHGAAAIATDDLDGLASDGPSPSQLAVERERETELREAGMALSNEQLTVLLLHDVDGVRLKDIARNLNASAQDVARTYLSGAATLRAAGVRRRSAADDPAQRLPHDRLADALEQLPPADRDAVLLKHLEDYSMTEAAEVLETTPGAVGSAVYRGVRQLKALLEAACTAR